MTARPGDYEYLEFYRWVKSEYPDMWEEFEKLPKTLVDFIEARYPYLIQEYVDDIGPPNIVYCT